MAYQSRTRIVYKHYAAPVDIDTPMTGTADEQAEADASEEDQRHARPRTSVESVRLEDTDTGKVQTFCSIEEALQWCLEERNQLRHDLEATKKHSHAHQLRKIEADLKKIEKDRDHWQHERDDYKGHADRLFMERNEARIDRNKARQDLQNLERKFSDILEVNARITQRNDELTAQKDAANSQMIKALNSRASYLGFQESDDVIEGRFARIQNFLKTWSADFALDVEMQDITDGLMQQILAVVPAAQPNQIREMMSDKKTRRQIIRGAVANYLFMQTSPCFNERGKDRLVIGYGLWLAAEPAAGFGCIEAHLQDAVSKAKGDYHPAS